MYNATSCPDNKDDFLNRSMAINCTEENPYMCLPNKGLTEILEICHHEPRKDLSPGKIKMTQLVFILYIYFMHASLLNFDLFCVPNTGLCFYLDTFDNFSIGLYGCRHFSEGCPSTRHEPYECEYHNFCKRNRANQVINWHGYPSVIRHASRLHIFSNY